MRKVILLICVSVAMLQVSVAQEIEPAEEVKTEEVQEIMITIKGKVIDAVDGQALVTMMAVSKKAGSGTFGNNAGQFMLPISKDDQLLVGAIGYETITYSIPEDFEGTTITKTFELNKLVVQLPPVEVLSDRELSEIQEDIERLGYEKKDYMVSGINAYNSPITFLYQSFSKRERSKRLVAELRNEDQKRELLKELFKKYVDYDIIQLEDDHFDEFIDYCNVSEHFMKSSSQYDFLVHIKKRFKEYQNSPQWLRNKGSDNEYYRK